MSEQADEPVVEYRRGSERWSLADKQWKQERGAPNTTPPPADPAEAEKLAEGDN